MRPARSRALDATETARSPSPLFQRPFAVAGEGLLCSLLRKLGDFFEQFLGYQRERFRRCRSYRSAGDALECAVVKREYEVAALKTPPIGIGIWESSLPEFHKLPDPNRIEDLKHTPT